LDTVSEITRSYILGIELFLFSEQLLRNISFKQVILQFKRLKSDDQRKADFHDVGVQFPFEERNFRSNTQ